MMNMKFGRKAKKVPPTPPVNHATLNAILGMRPGDIPAKINRLHYGGNSAELER